ncbi:MAG: hypothetical protein DCF22_22780 [Leptolyngbya sp.]|nr:MAG: hypothetical protein DCF22_22780 [Leptolyngbya sp.]
MKTVVEQKPLFEALSAEEAANVNGACWYYSNPCVNPCWSSGGWSGGGWSGGSSSITQTTNVNIVIDD